MEFDAEALLQGLLEQLGKPCRASRLTLSPMEADERGYSGARLLRLRCVDADGRESSFVCKYASKSERLAMRLLSARRRGHTPLAYADPSDTHEAAWLIMQDVRPCTPPPGTPAWKKQVASALADIHADHLAERPGVAGFPVADRDYWNRIVTAVSVDHFERLCETDNSFSARYAAELPRLRRRAERFAGDMAALWQEGKCLTLTHGDIQDVHGDHVKCFQGKPMLIDWGFCRWAPFYLDITPFFSPEEALVCYSELCGRGVSLRRSEFLEGYRMAAPYPLFIYLYPALAACKRGSADRLEKLLSLLERD